MHWWEDFIDSQIEGQIQREMLQPLRHPVEQLASSNAKDFTVALKLLFVSCWHPLYPNTYIVHTNMDIQA